MEILDPDRRRIVVVAAFVIPFMVSVLVGFALLTRPRTQFEREHAQALIGTPRWLKVEIATRDGRREYREGEAVFVVVHFSSAASHMYKADIDDGVSTSAASDVLHISNGERRPLNMTGIVCCDSRLIGLDDEPFTPPSWSPLKLPPGDYEIYLNSRRVFNWDTSGILTCCSPSPFEAASNILKIRVLPDPSGLRYPFSSLINR